MNLFSLVLMLQYVFPLGCLRENLGFEDTKSEPNWAYLAISLWDLTYYCFHLKLWSSCSSTKYEVQVFIGKTIQGVQAWFFFPWLRQQGRKKVLIKWNGFTDNFSWELFYMIAICNTIQVVKLKHHQQQKPSVTQ